MHSVNTTLVPREVHIPVGNAWLYGDLVLPPGFHGLVLLAQEKQCDLHTRCEKSLVIVPSATHLFEEEDALEQVAKLASSWFTPHLTSLQYTA